MNINQHTRSIISTVTKETRRMASFLRLAHTAQSAIDFSSPTSGRRGRSASAAAIVAVAVMGMSLSAVPAQAVPLPPYGVETFNNRTTGPGGTPFTQAGGHPEENVTEFTIPMEPELKAGVEQLNGAYVKPPLGFIGNPVAAPRCPITKVITAPNNGGDKSECSLGARIGTAVVRFATNGRDSVYPAETSYWPLYNLVPERGYPAQFGFKLETIASVVLSAVLLPRTEGYGLSIGTPNAPSVYVSAFTADFCSYGAEYNGTYAPGSCKSPSGSAVAPFLSNPVDCSEAEPKWSLAIDSMEHAGAIRELGVPNLSDPAWKTAIDAAPAVTGCGALVFDPSLAVAPLQPGGGPVQADQPTGLSVDLDFPQNNDPTDLNTTFEPNAPQTPEPKDITVALPAGLSINPSSASGLGACSDLASDSAGDQVHYDNTKPVTCPESSKIGTAVATSPLLATHDPVTDEVNGAEPIDGTVYLLKPHPGDLPIGGGQQEGKFRLLIQLENERYGINIKLPGVATANPQTGQLTATFTENPQLPASHITVNLKEGPRAPLATPVTCGSFQVTSDIVPWSTPGPPDAHPTANLAVGSGPSGAPCPAGQAGRPFAPAMSAGTESSAAGQTSPFDLHLTRNDGEQELGSLEATLPKGLAAKFVGVPYCSDAALAAAATRSGAEEQANPTCPASRIGSVTVAAGPGSSPFYAHGNAYLAGPYKGAPMSVAVITPAVAGPFDLGTVVVRNALFIDPETAQGRVVSDPFPKILDGVPLRLRSIDVNLDRPSFTLNPTNCSPLAINVKLTSTDGTVANPTNHFQAGGCDKLGFKPELSLSLKGATKRSGHPALKAVLNYPKGNYANIAKAVVNLPHSEFLAQNHIKTICTRVQFAADQCPPGSIYGYVTATTPLLEKPLEGPLYLRSSSNPLPDLVAALHGQIDIDLVGRIDSKHGGLRTTFESVPDAPVSNFVLTMQGGKKGLLENSKNLCKSVNRADVLFTAQNGLTSHTRPVLTNSCKKGKKGKKSKKGGKGK